MTARRFFHAALLFFALPAFSREARHPDLERRILACGMEVFALEDFSRAAVQVEMAFRAGASSQTPSNSGVFLLRSILFESALSSDIDAPPLNNARCESDEISTRASAIVSPGSLEGALAAFERAAFSPRFDDDDIARAVSKVKSGMEDFSQSAAGLINRAMDSRVFGGESYKLMSAPCADFFSGASTDEAREALAEISRDWLVPQNCAIFISGAVKKENAFSAARKIFGALEPSKNFKRPSAQARPLENAPSKRFVVHSGMFSPDMTQIAIQYTTLSRGQSRLVALALGAEGSSFKRAALSLEDARISDGGCIDAEAFGSRLVIQALLENDGSSPVDSARAFVECARNALDISSREEFDTARKKLARETNFKSAFDFARGFARSYLENSDSAEERIFECDAASAIERFKSESPFVFVIVNEDAFKKHSERFAEAGFEEVSRENCEILVPQPAADENSTRQNGREEVEDAVSLFARKASESVSARFLRNKIPVIFKSNPSPFSTLVSIEISRQGICDERPEIFELLIQMLALNARDEIDATSEGEEPFAEVDFGTTIDGGFVTIECREESMPRAIECVFRAESHGDVAAARADKIAAAIRARKSVESGDTSAQMRAFAARELIGDERTRAFFSTDGEAFDGASLNDIRAAYLPLLDASRHSVIVADARDCDKIFLALDSSFGLLSEQSPREKSKPSPAPLSIPKSAERFIPLCHLFLDGNSGGERPKTLVPTKEFRDPAQYWIDASDLTADERVALNALVLAARSRMEKYAARIPGGVPVSSRLATRSFPSAEIEEGGVPSVRAADEIFESAVADISARLEDDESFESLKEEMAALWILSDMGGADGAAGTARLIRAAMAEGDSESEAENAALYAKSAESAANIPLETARRLFARVSNPALKLRSKDSAR